MGVASGGGTDAAFFLSFLRMNCRGIDRWSLGLSHNWVKISLEGTGRDRRGSFSRLSLYGEWSEE